MKNITITLDETTAAWVRLYAAGRGTSVSRVPGELLQEQLRGTAEYDEAMRRYPAKPPMVLQGPDERDATRDEPHDRAGLRR